MMDLIVRTVGFALPVLVTIFLGLFFAGLMLEIGVLNRISSLSRPLVSVAHLPEICASSFVVSLGSTVAANSMIARFREDNLMQEREAFLCAMVNSIPAYIREIFTYQIPIVIPSLGLIAGSLYGLIFMITAAVKITLVVILGRILLEKRSYQKLDYDSLTRVPLAQAVPKAFLGQRRIFARIAVVYLIVTFLVFLLMDRGTFEALNILPLADVFGVPSESIIPLTTYVASPIMGLAMLGPMIHSGSLSDIQAMIVLMLGSMFMLPVFALRSMVPNYTALFGPRLGLSVVVFSTGISMLVRLIFLVAFLKMA
jgi:hypothetical protein